MGAAGRRPEGLEYRRAPPASARLTDQRLTTTEHRGALPVWVRPRLNVEFGDDQLWVLQAGSHDEVVNDVTARRAFRVVGAIVPVQRAVVESRIKPVPLGAGGGEFHRLGARHRRCAGGFSRRAHRTATGATGLPTPPTSGTNRKVARLAAASWARSISSLVECTDTQNPPKLRCRRPSRSRWADFRSVPARCGSA
jgi:hypothetical protein